MELLKENELPYGFKYPESIKKACALGLVNICPWSVMDTKRVKVCLDGLKLRYPNRKLIPFAERQDNDDIACFEMGKGEEVQWVHDFASVGWEQCGVYMDFYEWFKSILEDVREVDLVDCIESLKIRNR